MNRRGKLGAFQNKIIQHDSYFILENKCYHVKFFCLQYKCLSLFNSMEKMFNIFEDIKIPEIKLGFALYIQAPENIRQILPYKN